jgi:3D (Asp-Asp-Asp) domain-containing protein
MKLISSVFFIALLLSQCTESWATQPWKITAYCSCVKCCGKSDGITASGKKASPNHTIALNWLPFGSKVQINGVPYVVEDRGAESHFGTYYHRKGPKNQVKHIDIYMASHNEARNFGVKFLPVEVVR